MHLLYFPFTFISDSTANALYHVLGRVTVYQASALVCPPHMRKMADEGLIDIRIPVKGDESRIAALLKDYRSWSDLHNGNDIKFFKARQKRVPFYDETSVSQIRSDLKHLLKPQLQAPGDEALFSRRLFLHFAQQYDEHQMELNKSMEYCSTLQQNLVSGLQGNGASLPGSPFDPVSSTYTDPGHVMTAERLNCWAHLFRHDLQAGSVDMIVTSSRAAMELMLENLSLDEPVLSLDINTLPGNDFPERDRLLSYLGYLARHGRPPEDIHFCGEALPGRDGKLSIYLLRNICQIEMVSRLSGETPPEHCPPAADPDARHMLAGFLECQDKRG